MLLTLTTGLPSRIEPYPLRSPPNIAKSHEETGYVLRETSPAYRGDVNAEQLQLSDHHTVFLDTTQIARNLAWSDPEFQLLISHRYFWPDSGTGI
jgi:hypothetical protein